MRFDVNATIGKSERVVRNMTMGKQTIYCYTLAQHHAVMAVDIVPERVQKINNKQATIHDDYVEKYLREEKLRLTATLDAQNAYGDADYGKDFKEKV